MAEGQANVESAEGLALALKDELVRNEERIERLEGTLQVQADRIKELAADLERVCRLNAKLRQEAKK